MRLLPDAVSVPLGVPSGGLREHADVGRHRPGDGPHALVDRLTERRDLHNDDDVALLAVQLL